MIQLGIFLFFTKLANAVSFYCKYFSASLGVMTLSDQTNLTYCHGGRAMSLFGEYTLIFLVILGTLILLSLLISIIICIIYVTKEQGNRGQFHPARTQDSDDQDANSGTAGVQEEKAEEAEDELLYATVNHSGASKNSAPAVKFESGTDYATVVIN